MNNKEILRSYKAELEKIDRIIKLLSSDRREQAQRLREVYLEKRDNILDSIDCLEYTIKMEREFEYETCYEDYDVMDVMRIGKL